METSESTQLRTQSLESSSPSLVCKFSVFPQIRKAFLPILFTISCFSCAKDSDGDGLSDAKEILIGTDINNPDSDKDFLTDYQEVCCDLDPKNPDIDGDGLPDGCEVDLGSMMGGYVHDIIRRQRDRIAWEILVNGTQQRNLVNTLCVMSNDLDLQYNTLRLNECPWNSRYSEHRIYITHTDIKNPDTDGDGTSDSAGGQIVVPQYITLKILEKWNLEILDNENKNPCNYRFVKLARATQTKKID